MPGVYERKTTFHTAASGDANGTVANVQQLAVMTVQITGTFTTAVVYWEGTVDGSTWVGIQGTNLNTGAIATSATATGLYLIPIVGLRLFRARLDWTAGTSITVQGIATEAQSPMLQDVDVATISGIAPQFDNTDKLAVALYGKSSTTGDTAIGTHAAGYLHTQVMAITAGETHIGEVGGNSLVVTVTPAVTAGAYTALDIVGAIQTIANATRVSGEATILQSITVTDLAKQNVDLTIFFFNANPANGTYTDNIALDIHDTDMAMCVGKVKVIASDYSSAALSSVATVSNLALPLTPVATSLFAIAQASSTAPTYVSTSDLKFLYGFFRD